MVQVHRLVHQLPAMNQKMLGILLTHLNRVANKCDKVPYFPVLQIRDVYCLSRILIFIHPGSKSSNKKRGEKICCPTFFCSHKYHKIVNYFIFELVKKKTLGQITKNYRTF